MMAKELPHLLEDYLLSKGVTNSDISAVVSEVAGQPKCGSSGKHSRPAAHSFSEGFYAKGYATF
jgi:hypothetical protein